MSPENTTTAATMPVTLNRAAFERHFNTFWGAHEWADDAVLVLSYVPAGRNGLSSIHVPVELEAVWEKMVEIGSDRKMWIGIAPRSMGGLTARIADNAAWNAEHGDEVRAWNKEHAEAIEAGTKRRKRLKPTDLEWIRGGKEECYPMPGFFLDADVSMESSEHDEHKLDKATEGKEGRRFPSRTQWDLWLDAFPMKPTLKIWTGGGYHLWWSFLALLSEEEQMQFLARFKAYWTNMCEASGLHIDLGVIESSRVGRPAGSLKGKGDADVFFTPIQTVEFNPGSRFTTADMEFLPPHFNPRTEKRVRNEDGTVTVRPVSPRSQAELDALPGTKLSHNLPVSDILEQVLEFHRDGEYFTAPWEGDYEYGKVHAWLRTANDGAEVVKVYGDRTAADLGLDRSEAASSFKLLGKRWCKGDFALAARIATHYEASVEDLIELLQTDPSVEELQERFPDRSEIAPDSRPDRAEIERLMAEYVAAEEESAPGTLHIDSSLEDEINAIPEEAGISIPAAKPTIRDAIENGARMTWQLPGTNYFVQVTQGVAGLFETYGEEDEAGNRSRKVRELTNWIAYRSEAFTDFTLTPEGEPHALEEKKYTVKLITKRGEFHTLKNLSGKDSADASRIVDLANAGCNLPVSTVQKKQLDNVLRMLGYDDAQVRVDRYTSTGILADNGRHTYLQPAGSVNADGITHEYTVTAPAGSAANALRPSQAATGFDRIAEGDELVEAAKCIKAYLDITPDRLDYGIATLGALPAAVLPQGRRTSVFIKAKPFSGKSLSASCLQGFVSSVGVDGKSFSMTFSSKTTAFGAQMITGWHNNSLGIYDDFRMAGNRIEDEKRIAAFEAVAQGSYGSDGRAAGNGVGLQSTSTNSTMSVITGEGAPATSGEAIHSRLVQIQMGLGDFAISPRGASPLDHFAERYVSTGAARAFFANFIQWVMAKIDEKGSVKAFRDEVDRRKKSWESDVPGRAAETASTVVVGWMYMIDWATERGIAHLLPTMEMVTETMLAVARTNAESTADMSPGRQIVDKIAEMIAGGEGYIQSHEMLAPAGNEKILGWEKNHGYEGWTHGHRVPLGSLSKDRRYIHISANALNAVKAKLGLTGITLAQTEGFMEGLLRPGSKHGRAASDLGLTNRARGWTFAVETLELELAMPAEKTTPASKASKSSAIPALKNLLTEVDEADTF